MKCAIRPQEDGFEQALIECMAENLDDQDEILVGPFWYDTINQELFGVSAEPVSNCPFYQSKLFNQQVKTGKRLHQAIWKKEHNHGKDKRFSVGTYTSFPRGRVFFLENDGPVVCTGAWIDKYPEARDEILYEFQLPESTQFIKKEHWDIGHGWSQELL